MLCSLLPHSQRGHWPMSTVFWYKGPWAPCSFPIFLLSYSSGQYTLGSSEEPCGPGEKDWEKEENIEWYDRVTGTTGKLTLPENCVKKAIGLVSVRLITGALEGPYFTALSEAVLFLCHPAIFTNIITFFPIFIRIVDSLALRTHFKPHLVVGVKIIRINSGPFRKKRNPSSWPAWKDTSRHIL